MVHDLQLDDELFGFDFLADIERAEAIEELAFDPDKHPRHPAGSEDGGEFMPAGEHVFHVTYTKNVDKIKKKGLLMMQTSNWAKAGDKQRYGAGEVYVFEHEMDAKRWAARMDWEFNKTMGSGKISILKVKSSKGWTVDENDPLSQASAKGKWLKKVGAVPASEIVSAEPFTVAMARSLVGQHSEEDDNFLSYAFNPDQPRAGKGSSIGGRWIQASDTEAEAAMKKLKGFGHKVPLVEIFGKGRVLDEEIGADLDMSTHKPHRRTADTTVSLDSLKFLEHSVTRNTLNRMIDERRDVDASYRQDPPIVVKTKQFGNVLLDGHHRAVAAHLLGDKTIRAVVVESKTYSHHDSLAESVERLNTTFSAFLEKQVAPPTTKEVEMTVKDVSTGKTFIVQRKEKS